MTEEDSKGVKSLPIGSAVGNEPTTLIFAQDTASGNVTLQKADKYEDTNARNEYDILETTPLHLAIRSGNESRAQYLLSQGADVGAKDYNGNTPLAMAVIKNFIKLTDIILEKGADVNVKNSNGVSPLHIAVSHGHLELARNLIRHGANIDCRTVEGFTPLHMAVQRSLKDRLKVLVSSDINPLKTTFELCTLLIGEGAELNIRDMYGNTALHYAVKSESVILTELLLSRDVALDLYNQRGDTPLLLAFSNVKPTLCNLLMNKGADVNLSNKDGNTPLHLLVMGAFSSCSYTVLLRKLLESGANINMRNMDGNTVLMILIMIGFPQDEIMFFIRNGANINMQNNNGETPLMLALKTPLLLALMFPPNSSTIETDFLHIAPEKLIFLGAMVNVQDIAGNTPLHIAYKYFLTYEVQLLLYFGSDVNIQNGRGNTPLHIAMTRVDTFFLHMVLQRVQHVDLNIQNNLGDTPLHIALTAVGTRRDHASTSLIQKLIDNGARVDIKNNKNQTPLLSAKPGSEARKIVIKQIVKMRVAGLPVKIGFIVHYEDMEVKCLQEMEKIKATKINEKHTLDKLFSKNNNPIYLVSSEDLIEKLMDFPGLENKFPHYAPLLRVHYNVARTRLNLLNLAQFCLKGRRQIVHLQKLPYEIKQVIFEKLTNEDLISLIRGMQHTKKMLPFRP